MKKRISVCLVLLLGWLASYAQEPADSLAQPAAEQSESADPAGHWDAGRIESLRSVSRCWRGRALIVAALRTQKNTIARNICFRRSE